MIAAALLLIALTGCSSSSEKTMTVREWAKQQSSLSAGCFADSCLQENAAKVEMMTQTLSSVSGDTAGPKGALRVWSDTYREYVDMGCPEETSSACWTKMAQLQTQAKSINSGLAAIAS